MTKKLVVESQKPVVNEECLTCNHHGDCSVEFVGGEKKVLTAQEMDMVTAAIEMGQYGISAHWDRHSGDRNHLAKIIIEKGTDFSLASTPEGVDYYMFAMRQVARMQQVLDRIAPILLEAKNRADEAFAASKTAKN